MTRLIATLATLLLVIPVAAAPSLAAEEAQAAGADPSADAGLSAICVHEYSLAAAGTAADAAAADPAAIDGSAALPATSPSLDPGFPAGEAAAIGSSLDAAIRACASLEEWLEAAALHPDVLGPTSALAFLEARCEDPDAGLEGYATCRSLAVALATPEPLSTPELLPVPETLPPPTPSTVPEVTGVGDQDLPPEPEEEPATGRVTVDRRFRAHIPDATQIRYFTIRGRSAPELLRQNVKRARAHCRASHAVACVDLQWRVSYGRQLGGGSCTVGSATTKLQATVFLPRWKGHQKADAQLLHWWHDLVRSSAVHESKHIRIQAKHLGAFRRAVKGKACSAAEKILNRHLARASKAHSTFDRAEYRKPLPPIPTNRSR